MATLIKARSRYVVGLALQIHIVIADIGVNLHRTHGDVFQKNMG